MHTIKGYGHYFLEIQSFLKEHQKLWDKEVLNDYPKTLTYFSKEVIESLSKLSNESLWKFDSKSSIEMIEDKKLLVILKQIHALESKLPISKENVESYPKRAFHKISAKKKHEIENLAPIVNNLFKETCPTKVVDIGGGQGKMARIISAFHKIPFISVDQNIELQKIGIEKIQKLKEESETFPDVEFINHKFLHDTNNSQLEEIFKDNLSLGLHTCGPLALEQFKNSIQFKSVGIINFGCCYSSLNPNTDTNISDLAKNNPLPLNKFSLTLATRGHAYTSLTDFIYKRKVKNYRYALHLYHYHELNMKEFIPFGNGKKSNYLGTFEDYAYSFLHKEFKINESKEKLKAFYENSKNQKLINDMFLANTIRWQFGRLLELYILLDRVLYLEEKGLDPTIVEVFDQKESPRNIAIIAKTPKVTS